MSDHHQHFDPNRSDVMTYERIPESFLDLIQSEFMVDDTLLTRPDSLNGELSISGAKPSSTSWSVGNKDKE
jgi:hypothetical protein